MNHLYRYFGNNDKLIVDVALTISDVFTYDDAMRVYAEKTTKHVISSWEWQKQMEKQINQAGSIYEIYYLVNDAYKILFFDSVSKLLSKEDFSSLLADAWVSSDYANSDLNVSKKQMLLHFKNAEKSTLMTESEKQTFNELADIIVVYRGLSSNNKSNIKALSWTTSFGRAKWFANRWEDRGVIYAAEIDKKDVYAFFDRKNEDEVIVDYNKLQNIRIIEKPIDLPCDNVME